METPGELAQYDVVAHFDSLSQFIKDKRLVLDVRKPKLPLFMVGLIGGYNKGKTYFLNRIAETKLPSGVLESTRGLSFITANLEELDGITFVDTAGAGSPVVVGHAGALRDVQVVEGLINNLTFILSKILILIVNDLTNQDQDLIYTFLRDIEKHHAGKKIIILVHNLIHTDESNFETYFKTKVQTLFPVAGKVTPFKKGSKCCRYTSKVEKEGYLLEQYFLVNESRGSEEERKASTAFNDLTLERLRSMISNRFSRVEEKADIVDLLYDTLKAELPRYFVKPERQLLKGPDSSLNTPHEGSSPSQQEEGKILDDLIPRIFDESPSSTTTTSLSPPSPQREDFEQDSSLDGMDKKHPVPSNKNLDIDSLNFGDCFHKGQLEDNKQFFFLSGQWAVKDTPFRSARFSVEEREAIYGVYIRGSSRCPQHLVYLIEVPGASSAEGIVVSKPKEGFVHVTGTRPLHYYEQNPQIYQVGSVQRIKEREFDVAFEVPRDMRTAWDDVQAYVKNGILEVHFYEAGFRKQEEPERQKNEKIMSAQVASSATLSSLPRLEGEEEDGKEPKEGEEEELEELEEENSSSSSSSPAEEPPETEMPPVSVQLQPLTIQGNNLTLSENKKVVRKSAVNHCCIILDICYSSGLHRWNVQVLENKLNNGYWIMLGVHTNPTMAKAHPDGDGGVYGVSVHGNANGWETKAGITTQNRSDRKIKPFEIITVSLDCDEGKMRFTHPLWIEVIDVPRNTALYPYFDPYDLDFTLLGQK